MTRARNALLCLLSAVLFVAVSGCGSDPMNAATVTGKVTVDGKALTRGSVRFVPDKSKGNNATTEPTGTIGSNGEYSLVTNGKPGAPLGWFKVSVVAAEPLDSSKATATPKSDVALKFNDPEKSGLSVEVVSSPAAGAYDLKTTAK